MNDICDHCGKPIKRGRVIKGRTYGYKCARTILQYMPGNSPPVTYSQINKALKERERQLNGSA